MALIVDVTAGHGLSHGIAAAAAAQVDQAGGPAHNEVADLSCRCSSRSKVCVSRLRVALIGPSAQIIFQAGAPAASTLTALNKLTSL